MGTIRSLSAYKEKIMTRSRRVTSLFFLYLLVTTFAGVGAALLLQGAEAARDAVSSADFSFRKQGTSLQNVSGFRRKAISQSKEIVFIVFTTSAFRIVGVGDVGRVVRP